MHPLPGRNTIPTTPTIYIPPQRTQRVPQPPNITLQIDIPAAMTFFQTRLTTLNEERRVEAREELAAMAQVYVKVAKWYAYRTGPAKYRAEVEAADGKGPEDPHRIWVFERVRFLKEVANYGNNLRNQKDIGLEKRYHRDETLKAAFLLREATQCTFSKLAIQQLTLGINLFWNKREKLERLQNDFSMDEACLIDSDYYREGLLKGKWGREIWRRWDKDERENGLKGCDGDCGCASENEYEEEIHEINYTDYAEDTEEIKQTEEIEQSDSDATSERTDEFEEETTPEESFSSLPQVRVNHVVTEPIPSEPQTPSKKSASQVEDTVQEPVHAGSLTPFTKSRVESFVRSDQERIEREHAREEQIRQMIVSKQLVAISPAPERKQRSPNKSWDGGINDSSTDRKQRSPNKSWDSVLDSNITERKQRSPNKSWDSGLHYSIAEEETMSTDTEKIALAKAPAEREFSKAWKEMNEDTPRKKWNGRDNWRRG